MGLERRLLSLRTTALILCLLILFLILNVVIPQERVVGKEAIERAVAESAWKYFLLEDLGLTRLPTSYPFLLILGAMYMQLIVLLWKLGRSTRKRVQQAPASWEKWKSVIVKNSATKSVVEAAAHAGFRLRHLDESSWWGVRNRYSPAGFLILHGSFILLLSGGLLLYYTRTVIEVAMVSGDTQVFSGSGPGKIVRSGPFAPSVAPFSIQLVRVEAKKEMGEPVALKARVRFLSDASAAERDAAVNHPASFLGFNFLPMSTDLAASFRLYDRSGFPLDTVVALTQCQAGRETTVPLAKPCSVVVECREKRTALLRCGEEKGKMALEVGESITTDSYYLTLASLTPWVSFLVVYERGSMFLVAGFALAVAGLIMRFLFPRQDIVITTESLHFRGEFFPLAFEEFIQKMEGKSVVTN